MAHIVTPFDSSPSLMRPACPAAAAAAARKPAQASSDAVVKAARSRAGGVGNLAVITVLFNWGEAAAATGTSDSSAWPGGSWPGHGPGTGPGGALRRSATWWAGRSGVSRSSSSSSSSGGGSARLRRSAASWLGRAGGRAESAVGRGLSTPSGGSVCSSGRSTPFGDADRCGLSLVGTGAGAGADGGCVASEQGPGAAGATRAGGGIGGGSGGGGGDDESSAPSTDATHRRRHAG
jgi:hypothetical protein